MPADRSPSVLGLSTAEAESRLLQYGGNALPEQPPIRWWRRAARQFRSALISILLFALAFDLVVWFHEGRHGWPFEALAIGTILLFNATMGAWQEHRSEDALSKLKLLATPQAWVMRDGVLRPPRAAPGAGSRSGLRSGPRLP